MEIYTILSDGHLTQAGLVKAISYFQCMRYLGMSMFNQGNLSS